jgi:CheY-like chemotaxis protein
VTLKPFMQPSPQQRTPIVEARKVSLLYVEDEDANWDVVRLNLRGKYEVTRARDAAEVFSTLNYRRFDAILMDIQLSGSEYDGIGITQMLKGRVRAPATLTLPSVANIPIIFMTAYTARYNEHYLQSIGGDALVGKPVDFSLLALTIARCTIRRTLAK